MCRSCDTKVDQLAGDNQSDEKKIKRKRKKSKTQENEGVANMEVPPLSMNEKSGSHLEVKDRNSDANSSQVRMMSNGLVIEELITGKPDGKIACQGKKASLFVFSWLNNLNYLSNCYWLMFSLKPRWRTGVIWTTLHSLS